MRAADVIRLVALGAIWGLSFLFMRVLAPVLGAVLTADLRLLIAGLALVAWFGLTGVPLEWRRHGKHYLVIGAVGAAMPFLCFTFAARHIPASYSAILNASSPLFGALFSTLWLGIPFTRRIALGLALGLAGVALVANVRPAATDDYYYAAVGACVLASIGYGLSATYIRRCALHVSPRAIAAGNQLVAGLLLLPLLPFSPAPRALSALEIFDLLALALLCSAVAYVVYYRLIAEVGAARTLTVTFLVPMFGMLWGALFLHEAVTAPMLAGCALVIAGTYGINRA
jgi:drug/metabolite transporter (DMT)-like permease